MVAGTRCSTPPTFATLKFLVPEHEPYPQALVLGLGVSCNPPSLSVARSCQGSRLMNLALPQIRTQDFAQESQQLGGRPKLSRPARNHVFGTTCERAIRRRPGGSELHHERTFREERRRLAGRPTGATLIICVVHVAHGHPITQTGAADLEEIMESF